MIDVLLSSTPLDLNDLSIGVTFTALDISESKQAEQASLESEEKYKLLFEDSPIGIGISNLEGQVLAMNKAMEEMTGYNIRELNEIGLAATYIRPEIRVDLIKEIQEKGSVHNFELELRKKDGTEYVAILNIDLIQT